MDSGDWRKWPGHPFRAGWAGSGGVQRGVVDEEARGATGRVSVAANFKVIVPFSVELLKEPGASANECCT